MADDDFGIDELGHASEQDESWREQDPNTRSQSSNAFRVHWHGEPDTSPLREWLIDKTLTKVGTGLLSGQWGTYKTFVAMHLAACIMAKLPFAGREVHRQGGVLFFAVEGQDEVKIRLQAVINEKVVPALERDIEIEPIDVERMPYAWIESCPPLSSPDALPKLREIVGAVATGMQERYGLPLALIIIDTLSPAAAFKDANDTAENQRVMSVLKAIAFEFRLFVMAVDHFGKDVSTGTRNSSVKEGDVDTVLALLGDRDIAGNVARPRMAIRKVRGAPTGTEIAFDKRVVQVVHQSIAETTLVIDFAQTTEEKHEAAKSLWPKSLLIFKEALVASIIDFGRQIKPHADGPTVTAVWRERVREEFLKSYPADNDKAKGEAFRRCEKTAIEKDVMQARQIGNEMVFWLLVDDKVT